MKRSFLWALLLVFSCLGYAHAQTKITGKVTDEKTGEPIPFASIVVKGTIVGVNSDDDGNYSITLPSGGKSLIFTEVGHKDLEVEVGGRTVINVAMEALAMQLDEVVVVAYGTAKKASITGSVANVSGDKLERKNTTEISKALQGEIAGVSVISESGQPGANAKIRIRGFSSVNSSRAPLYVVDGVPYDGDVSAIDPADIESTSILKDASSAALYGSRAANGVVLITTKRGNKNKTTIDVDVKFGVNMRLLPMYDAIESPERYTELGWESLRNFAVLNGLSTDDAGQWASKNIFNGKRAIPEIYNMWNTANENVIDPTTGRFSGASRKYTPEKWEDHIFRDGKKAEASLRFAGGADKISYYASFGALKDEGYYIKSDFSRLNARTNLDFQPRTWLKTIVNMAYSYMELNDPGQSTVASNNGFAFVNEIPYIFPVYQRDASGNRIKDSRVGGWLFDYGDQDGNKRPYGFGLNPAGAIQLDKSHHIYHQIAANANFEISFLKDFKFISSNGFQYLGENLSEIMNPYYGDGKSAGGRVYKTRNDYLSYTTTQRLTYSKRIDDHSINAFVAHESSFYSRKWLNGSKHKMARPDIAEFSNAVIMDNLRSYALDRSLESYFMEVRYDYKDKYFANASFRRDGSSRFKNNKWGNFGSLGAAWMITKESFMENISWLKELRVKASYGTYGNEEFSTTNATANYYPTQDLYTIENLDDQISYVFSYKGNHDLTWEKSNMFNAGFDFKISDVLSGELEFFKKRTTNMLFMKQTATSLGYAQYPVNDAQLNNTGIEFSFTGHIIKTKDIVLDIRVNGAHYRNKMAKMPEGDGGVPKTLEIQGNYGWSKDRSIYDYYMREYAGVDYQTGQAEWYAYYDVKNPAKPVRIKNMVEYVNDPANTGAVLEKRRTKKYDDATLDYIGKSAIPDLTGGFGIDFSYKNIDLTANFIYNIGGYGYDYTYAGLMHNDRVGSSNWHKDINNRWTEAGQTTNVPRLSNDEDVNVNSRSSRFLTKNNYLGLTNVRLAYNLPKEWLKKINVSALSIWISGDNLAFWSARKGFIPLMSETGTTTNNTYAPVSTIVGGIKVHF